MGETKGTFFVKIKTNSWFTNADYLAKAAELAKKYGNGTLERTTRQSVENQGVPGTNVDKLMAEIYASGLATIGMGYCTEGLVGQVRQDIDYEKCNGCGRCAELCRVDVISIVLGKAVIDRDKCISCGWCIRSSLSEAVIETERGYTMWIGGNDARRPADGIWLKSFCTKEEIQGLTLLQRR
jgi:coenzyme F420 hydrogenase subunit beta